MTAERRALLVGINDYDFMPLRRLTHCVDDVQSMLRVLEHHDDGTTNFECHALYGVNRDGNPFQKAFKGEIYVEDVHHALLNRLHDQLVELFDFPGTVLFYFSGHGYIDAQHNRYLVSQDGNPILPGMLMNTILQMANDSPAREVVLIIDSCFGGGMGDAGYNEDTSRLFARPGVTLLAAAKPDQMAMERVFTPLVVGALEGGASDIRGVVNASAIYAYVEQVLGAWEQRPIYKTNTAQLTPLRFCVPDIGDEDLRLLPKLFPTADAEYQLDPTYEITHERAIVQHVTIFKIFKRYHIARILRPTRDSDLYFAAINERTVHLTPLGQFYWRLAKAGRLGIAPTYISPRRTPMPEPEYIAKLFHEAYERLAPHYGYRTREATRVAWDQVPDVNKRLMIATAGEVLAELFPPHLVNDEPEETLNSPEQ